MRDVLILCEGHTEREFCKRIVAPFVATSGVSLAGTLVGKPQKKEGGIRKWSVYRKEILRIAHERADRHVGVLVDYYGMPESWPGRSEAGKMTPSARGAHVESGLCNDLASEIGERFHPCVQLHEFESLLFVRPEITARNLSIYGPSEDALHNKLQAVYADCNGGVEQIDDSPQTAPSKRLTGIMPAYDKVAWGIAAISEVNVIELREGCPWLNRWLARLEGIGGKA